MFVYLVTNKIDGKQYIGQTSKTVEARWQDHITVRNRPSCSYLHNAICKHGADNFKIETLVQVGSKWEMDRYEIGMIKALNTKAPNGYNLTDGGDGVLGFVFSEEQRRKVSEGLLGRKMSEKARQKLLERNAGNKFSLGSKMPEEHRLKLIALNTGSKPSEKTRMKMSEAQKGRKHLLETRLKMSEVQKGNTNAAGSVRSAEHIKKLTQAGVHVRCHVKKGVVNPQCFLCKEHNDTIQHSDSRNC
jgi:group I intron endonuclease